MKRSAAKQVHARSERTSWALVSPLVAILSLFLVLPILTIVMVSFWDYNEWSFFPAFIFDNYEYVLTSNVTLATYLKTLKFTVLTWTFSVVIELMWSIAIATSISSGRASHGCDGVSSASDASSWLPASGLK